MKQRQILLAIMPRGIDGMFLPRCRGVTFQYFVPANSQESKWAKAFLGDDCIASYSFTRSVSAFPTTEEILSSSTIVSALRKRGVKKVFLTSSFTPRMFRWARAHRMAFFAPSFRLQLKLENKLWFDRFLEKHHLPKPKTLCTSLNHLHLSPPFVVQIPDSMGGEGTFIIRDCDELQSVNTDRRLRREKKLLVREFIEGTPFGITIMVTHERIALSALRRQCYFESGASLGQRTFAGIQWVPTAHFEASQKRRLEDIFFRLGALLHRQKFRGFANVDFILSDSGDAYLLECNPRMSSSSPQLLSVPSLIGIKDPGRHYLDLFLRRRRKRSEPVTVPIPRTVYAGATLDISFVPSSDNRSLRIKHQFPCGVYRFTGKRIDYKGPDPKIMEQPREFFVYTPVRRGQVIRSETTLATVISHQALYKDDGTLNEYGRRIFDFFRF